MRPRPWSVLLWVLLLSTARVSTLVDFEGLLEPRVALTPELGERLAVLAVGARSLVVVPMRDLARGERVLLPVTGRMEAPSMTNPFHPDLIQPGDMVRHYRVVSRLGSGGQACAVFPNL